MTVLGGFPSIIFRKAAAVAAVVITLGTESRFRRGTKGSSSLRGRFCAHEGDEGMKKVANISEQERREKGRTVPDDSKGKRRNGGRPCLFAMNGGVAFVRKRSLTLNFEQTALSPGIIKKIPVPARRRRSRLSIVNFQLSIIKSPVIIS
ncbi:MAG TPA: hypothetical protein PK438_05745 [Clostridia bacterium]|nr:hypothetical protein [Clostridia bacterium]